MTALIVSLVDYEMQWNPMEYRGIHQITVSFFDVWVPERTLSSPAKKLNYFLLKKTSDRIRFYENGLAQ